MTEPKFDLNVTLSLFDGISCGQEALKKAGISTRIFLASEIEKYPKMITRKNHPLTVQLGDVTKVVADDLPHVNLLMGGSPCQGFSFAGKQLNFDDPRSALFFEFVRLLKECKPDYFLLENVMMKQEYQDIITEHLGVEPVMINSALVSAQNRKRLYWTNIPGVDQPKDKGILLKDVLEDGIASDEMTTKGKSYCLTARYSGAVAWNSIEKKQRTMVKTEPTEPKVLIIPEQVRVRKHEVDIKGLQHCLLNALANSNKNKKQVAKELNDKFSTVEHYFRKVGSEFFCIPSEHHWFDLKAILNITTNEFDVSITEFEIRDGRYDMADRVYNPEYKAPTVIASSVAKVLCGRIVGRKINPETGKRDDYNPDLKAEQRLEPRLDEKSGTLTTVQKDNVLIVPEATKKGYTEIEDGDCFDATFINSKTRRGRNMKDKSNCLTAANFDYMRYEHPTYRKLTPIECERLQTLPDNYTEGVSNTQRYKALGNGWTVDVIVHILQGLKQQVKAVAA